jgi:hypothetical protein
MHGWPLSRNCGHTGGRHEASVTRDFEELFACFGARRVKALIVGAHAVAFYAKPRYTKDIDLFVGTSEDNAHRILGALADFGFGGLSLEAADFTTEGQIIQLGVEPNRVDLLTSLPGLSFESAWNRRMEGWYGKQRVFYIAKVDLIAAKEAAGRPQDLIDLGWLRDSD